MLAEDVRTGKLGGVCLVNTATNMASSGSGDAVPADLHCDLCGSFVMVLPAFVAQTMPSFPGHDVAGMDLSFDLAANISGLPPSRGPPTL